MSKRRRNARTIDGGRSWGPIVIGAVVVAVIAAFIVVVVVDFRSGSAGGPPSGVEDIDVGEAGQHIEGSVNYDQTPPVGGEHNSVWQNAGFYEEPVQSENAVHTLEHGAVWVTYSPDLPQGQVDELQNLANSRDCIVVSPYPDLGSPVVASAWGKQLRLEGADDPALNNFVGSYLRGPQTPEPGATCTGGVGTPS
ncbi:MAG: DUF3105 domain-containing protein [Rubrobacteraceae bacterium]